MGGDKIRSVSAAVSLILPVPYHKSTWLLKYDSQIEQCCVWNNSLWSLFNMMVSCFLFPPVWSISMYDEISFLHLRFLPPHLKCQSEAPGAPILSPAKKMTNINDWQPRRDKVAHLANSLCQRKKSHNGSLSDGIGDERNEDFGAVSIPQCLSHAFYTRSKCHLWYNTAL